MPSDGAVVSRVATGPEGEAAAQNKFACAACGGEAVWNPARQALICASCGTPLADAAAHAAPSPGPAHALPAALAAETGAASRADAGRIAVKCQHCDAVSYFDRGTAADRCSFCGSAEIVPYDALGDRYRPETVVPFRISEGGARDAAIGWIRSRWLAPGRLTRLARTDVVQGRYLPFWAFGAHASGTWSGEGSEGGTVEQRFEDMLICAASDLAPNIAEAIEPFPAEQRYRYEPRFVAGWTVVRARTALPQAVPLAHARIERTLLGLARRKASRKRDKVRIMSVAYADETFCQTLLPVWLLTYTYLGRSYQIAVNGATAAASGVAPVSIFKVLLVLLALGWVYLFFNDAEFALKLPVWIIEGLWWLLSRPFAHG